MSVVARYVSIDIETFGLDPESCDIIEFGAVLDNDPNKSVNDLPKFHCYFNKPDGIYKGQLHAFEMHSKSAIISKMIKNKHKHIKEEELDKKFAQWLEYNGWDLSTPVLIAGKNFAYFDLPFLKRIGFGRSFSINHRIIDVGSMYFNPYRDKFPHSLSRCLQMININRECAHTAIEDAMDVVLCIRNYGTYLSSLRKF